MERFWNKVDKAADCWLWVGAKSGDGYGRVWYRQDGKKRSIGSHRIAYANYYGPIPEGHFVCHRCDTPACVNPAHLFHGTSADNNRDRHTKGRTKQRNNCRLTLEQVRYVRYSPAKASNLADVFGITKESIYNIRNRKTWAEVV